MSKPELSLDFLRKKGDEIKRERAAKVKANRKKKEETVEEAFERIGRLKLNEQERQMFEIAKEAFFNGEIGRLESGKKLTKGEVLSMAAAVMRQREEKEKEKRIKHVLETKPSNFHILTDDEQLPHFLQRLREEVRLQMREWKGRFKVLGVESMTAGDYEGTGVDPYIDLSIGYACWLPLLNEGFYLPYGHVSGVIDSPYAFKEGDKQLTRSKVIEILKPYMQSEKHGKTFHMGSARYDLHIAQNDGYKIKGCVWDTLDAMHIMTEHLDSYGLKQLIQRYGKYLGIEGEVYTFEDLFGNRSPAPFNTELVGIYAIKDVYYGWKLFEWQFETMAKTNRLLECYAKIDSKLPELDVYMARCGFIVDLDELAKLEEEFSQKIEEAKQAVFTAYNIDDEFIYNMNMKLNGKKIRDWVERQRKKREGLRERLRKQEEIIKECEESGRTDTKKYQSAIEQAQKYKEQLAELTDEHIKPENAPDYVHEFEFTNNNHIGYLIYDHLKIEDKTPRFKRGKTRSTAAEVLKAYYEDEEQLKPLATVAEYEKLLNTYVRKIPEALEIDGRFHSEFKSGGTTTGRYSSSAYNGRPTDILKDFL